mmetsp:Transcript_32783/g.49541  ORF Transcript_32783/g.49541 Transcript_32783/m.49541 type:complete len:702 (+) Transcript_32783:477-2582(+)
MRGPTSTPIIPLAKLPTNSTSTTTPTPPPKVGEELLYNITFLCNSYEDQLKSTHSFVSSTSSKVTSLANDVHQLQSSLQKQNEKIDTLTQVLSILNTMEQDVSVGRSRKEAEEILMTQLASLEELFSVQELRDIQYDGMILPSLVSPFIECYYLPKYWNEKASLFDEKEESSSHVCREIVTNICHLAKCICSHAKDKEQHERTQQLIYTLVTQHVVPRVKHAFQSTLSWDPLVQVEDGLRLYESLIDSVKENENDMGVDDDVKEEEGLFGVQHDDEDVIMELQAAAASACNQTSNTKTLMNLVKEEIMFDVIYPRLYRTLHEWKPIIFNQQLQHPLHTWIVPWLPHLNHRSMLQTLLPDVQRKIKSTLTFLARRYKNDADDDIMDYFQQCQSVIQPWRMILETQIIYNLVSESMVPRLGRLLSKMTISISGKKQDWSRLDLVCELLDIGLLSQFDFISLVEGEVMSHWADTLHEWISSKMEKKKEDEGEVVNDVVEFYIAWRTRMMHPHSTLSNNNSSKVQQQQHQQPVSWLVLQKDEMICRHFHAALLMIQALIEKDEDALEDLTPPVKEEMNYRIVSARRARETRMEEEIQRNKRASAAAAADTSASTAAAGIATTRTQRENVDDTTTASFRDVVEEYAKQHDVTFHPRMGPNSTKDGKPIFLFGSVSIYLDSNVVFALRGVSKKWEPISLDDLVRCSL